MPTTATLTALCRPAGCPRSSSDLSVVASLEKKSGACPGRVDAPGQGRTRVWLWGLSPQPHPALPAVIVPASHPENTHPSETVCVPSPSSQPLSCPPPFRHVRQRRLTPPCMTHSGGEACKMSSASLAGRLLLPCRPDACLVIGWASRLPSWTAPCPLVAEPGE